MYRYGKGTRTAIAAMSRLAEVYDGGKTALSSLAIASSRRLPHPLVAKILSILSQSGLVRSTPGPGGGYMLARAPAEIRLKDVATLFDREDPSFVCPFGPDWCGNNDPCPLHDQIQQLNSTMAQFLESNTLEQFQATNARARRHGRQKV